MTMMEAPVVVGVVALLAALTWAWRRASQAAVPGPRRVAWQDEAAAAPGRRLVLDVAAARADDPAVQRLVADAAHRALAADRALDEVEVVARDGRSLGHHRRPEPLPPEVALPEALREPHPPPRRTPSPVPRSDPGHPTRRVDPAPEVRSAPLADRIELATELRRRIEHPDRATDVLRVILEASGRSVTVDGDLLVTDDVAVAVVDPRRDAEQALSHGYLRIATTSAPRGLIVRLGYADPALVRRRDAAAAHVRHVGPYAIQRMADAVAVGADPIAFAAGPATIVR